MIMRSSFTRERQWRSLLLLAPPVFFLLIFFVWPLFSMVHTSVSDRVLSQAFPSMPAAIAAWDRHSAPTPDMLRAFAADVASSENPQLLGEAGRRLNAAVPGFRSLMARTNAAIREAGAESVDLVAADPRWNDPVYWRAIADGLPPYTDKFLLAAVDLERSPEGSIERMSPDLSANLTVLGRTFWMSLIVTCLCVAIGLPYAMIAASVGGMGRKLLLLSLVIPMWTAIMVRVAAWFIILQQDGVLNGTLLTIGVLDQPLQLLFSRPGVIIAMTHLLLPFMIFPIYSVLVAVPPNIFMAAAALGANPLMSFIRITVPLSWPGVVSGTIMVFMTSIGFYILPVLLGGPRDQLISSVIAFYAINTANRQMASALGVVLLVMTMILYILYSRWSVEKTAGENG